MPVVLAYLGIILPLIYTVRLVQNLLFGEERYRGGTLADLSPREVAILAVLAILVVSLGVHPTPVLDLVKTPGGDFDWPTLTASPQRTQRYAEEKRLRNCANLLLKQRQFPLPQGEGKGEGEMMN